MPNDPYRPGSWPLPPVTQARDGMSPHRFRGDAPAPPQDPARIPAGPGVVRSERDGAWFGARQPVRFGPPDGVFGDTDGVISRGILRLGPFDLFPELRDSPGPTRPAVPIFRPGAMLTLQLWKTDNFHLAGADYEVSAIEIGHVADAREIRQLSTNQWITGDFYEIESLQDSVTLWWSPQTNLRYWGVIVVFDQVEGQTPLDNRVPLIGQGGML